MAEKTRERVPKRKIGVLKDKPESDTKTKQDVRYQSILSTMHRTGSVTVEALAEILDVTVVTIRRDLDALERKGLLNRTHGGAVRVPGARHAGDLHKCGRGRDVGIEA